MTAPQAGPERESQSEHQHWIRPAPLRSPTPWMLAIGAAALLLHLLQLPRGHLLLHLALQDLTKSVGDAPARASAGPRFGRAHQRDAEQDGQQASRLPHGRGPPLPQTCGAIRQLMVPARGPPVKRIVPGGPSPGGATVNSQG